MKWVEHRLFSLAMLGAVATLVAACPAPEAEWEPAAEEAAAPAAEMARIYEAELHEVDGSGVTGTAVVTVYEDDRIEIDIMAHGLDPDQRVMQHVHTSSTCDEPGGILLNLDNRLTFADEAEARGDDYPEADGDGMLEYEASRSVDDIRDAAREHGVTGIEQLELANRVVNLHDAAMQSIACGPLTARSR